MSRSSAATASRKSAANPPNGAMVRVANFVAHLAPRDSDSAGSGTAILSETYLPDGKVSVFYAATVAGTSGGPTNAALVGNPTLKARAFTPRLALPQLKLSSSRGKETGGSLTGLYDVNSAAPDALFATRLLSTGKASRIVVTTSRFQTASLRRSGCSAERKTAIGSAVLARTFQVGTAMTPSASSYQRQSY
jgi:hypothetical protein